MTNSFFSRLPVLLLAVLLSASACKQAATTATGPNAKPAAEVAPAPAQTGDASPIKGTEQKRVEPVKATAPAVGEKAASKAQIGKATDDGLAKLAGAPFEHWYGVYLAGNKVGHASMIWRTSRPDEPGAWTAITDVEMTVKGRGNAVKMLIKEARHYAGTAPYALVATTMSQKMGGVTDDRSARLEDGKLVITRTVDGRPQPGTTVDSPKESLRDLAKTAPRSFAGLKAGTKTSAVMFNWQFMKEEPVDVEVKRLETLGQAGVSTRVATIAVTLKTMNLTMESRVAEPGVTLEMTMGPGMKMKLEEESVAKADITGLDVLGSGVAVDKKLGDPRTVKGLKLSIGVASDFIFPQTANQKVSKKGDRFLVALTAAPGDAVTEEARKKALVSDSLIDADHAAIKAKSVKLLEGAGDDRDKVVRLVDYVYKTLAKRLATNLPTASKVLEEKVGDCTEHTWLFVALARASGLPARPAYGLAYIGDAHQSFGYHAWVEVALDGKWVAVDPTWNQHVADATHLRLGDELHSIATVIGGLDIKVSGAVERR